MMLDLPRDQSTPILPIQHRQIDAGELLDGAQHIREQVVSHHSEFRAFGLGLRGKQSRREGRQHRPRAWCDWRAEVRSPHADWCTRWRGTWRLVGLDTQFVQRDLQMIVRGEGRGRG